MILDEIVEWKRQEVAAAKGQRPLADLQAHLAGHLGERSLSRALHRPGRLTLLAELKRKSPSKGMLRERFDPVSLAQALEAAGASALSVLTDERFFGGSLDTLRDVKQFSEVPVLRKDFVVDPYQVYEAAFYGADAVLLIVRILTQERLVECLQAADLVGLEALVEVHREDELRTALGAGAHLIGINHRDLETFALEAGLSARLAPSIPQGKVIVAESGIQTAEDVRRMQALPVHALLIGEALMTSPDVGARIRELFQGVW